MDHDEIKQLRGEAPSTFTFVKPEFDCPVREAIAEVFGSEKLEEASARSDTVRALSTLCLQGPKIFITCIDRTPVYATQGKPHPSITTQEPGIEATCSSMSCSGFSHMTCLLQDEKKYTFIAQMETQATATKTNPTTCFFTHAFRFLPCTSLDNHLRIIWWNPESLKLRLSE